MQNYRKCILAGFLMLSSLTALAAETGSAEARFGLKFEPVDFTPPPINRLDLDNGIGVRHYAEKEVPLVTVLVRVHAGSVNDPPGKVGATQLTGEVIRNGGSVSLPGDELDRELESRGAQLSVDSDREETWFRLSVLPADLEWGLKILSDLLAHPAFPADKLDEARGRQIVELRQRLDQPASSARALFPQLVFGKGNPWGWTPTERTLAEISIGDLRGIYDKHYRTQNLMLGFAGDVTLETAKDLAGQHFGLRVFKTSPEPDSTLPDVRPTSRTQVFIAERAATQNVIAFGHEGISRFDEQKFPVKLFNLILSDGFTSRLFREVRSNRGLAYSVGGRIGEGTKAGIYSNLALTKSASSTETLLLMIDVNKQLQEELASDDEVVLARQSAVNSFVFLFDTAEQMVRQQMTLDGFGYPANYLQTYVGNMKEVTAEEVRAAAREKLHLDRIVILVLGDVGEAARAELAKLGPLTIIDDKALRSEWL